MIRRGAMDDGEGRSWLKNCKNVCTMAEEQKCSRRVHCKQQSALL